MRARRPRRRRTESNRVRVQITRSLHTPVAGSFRINFTRPSGSVSRLMTALPSNISGVRFHRVEHVGEHLGHLGTGTRGNACPRRTHDSFANGWSLEQELSVPFRPVPCRSPSPAHDSARGKTPRALHRNSTNVTSGTAHSLRASTPRGQQGGHIIAVHYPVAGQVLR